MFVIEDTDHSEIIGEYPAFSEVVSRLKALAELPWDKEPNRAPCVGWKTCGREYMVTEYDRSVIPSREIRRIPALEIDATTVYWHKEFTDLLDKTS